MEQEQYPVKVKTTQAQNCFDQSTHGYIWRSPHKYES